MKKLFFIGVSSIVIGYCLLSIISNYIGLGPLDTFPRNIQSINCQNGVEGKVFRQKMLLDFLIGTDNRLEIKKDKEVIFNERLYWADVWNDVKPENTVLECIDNGIKTSSKRYFDNIYQIESKNRIVIEKKYSW